MRAVRYEGPDKGVRLSSAAEEPDCPLGWAVVRPLRVGIGSLERAIVVHANGRAPITLGHEFVGIVEHVNPRDVNRERYIGLEGRRVVASINIVCQQCDMCLGGLSTHCRERRVLGLERADGCFADVVVVPLPNLFVVPESIDDDRAVFAEPLAAAVQAAQQVRIEAKPYVTVLGDGTVGLLCAQILARRNASVRLIGRHQSKLEIAEKWGIQHRQAQDVGRRADQDIVIDCTGSTNGFELAIALARPRGKIVLKSRVMAREREPSVDIRPVVENELELVGSRCGPIPEALSLLERDAVDVLSLITRRTTLDDAEKALERALDPREIKVLMDL